MRILAVHSYYQQPGGEDMVFEAETALLEAGGHQVARKTFSNQEIPEKPGIAESIRLGLSTIWSRSANRQIQEHVRHFRPDVVHFHNTFPLVSPSAYKACNALGIPVVQTLHNYRAVCANAVMIRDGRICQDCVGRAVPLPAVKYACYRSSVSKSAVVGGMQMMNRFVANSRRAVTLYVALSQSSRDIFVRSGIDPERISIKPNFVPHDPGCGDHQGGYALFAGRLSPEKGVRTLLEAWNRWDPGLPLMIAGDGPERDLVERAAGQSDTITWLGRQSPETLVQTMGDAKLLVFPSEWYETFGLTIIEAFARGTPVVASRLGTPAELVSDGGSGLLFEAGNAEDLARTVRRLVDDSSDYRAMVNMARKEYLERYSAAQNLRRLEELYEVAIERKRAE